MHTRQDAAGPAQPNPNADALIEKLRESLAPFWAPLEKLCPPGICEQFMFMGQRDGIHFYKHVDTRCYLNVDAAGGTYGYDYKSSCYFPISVGAAMRSLEAGPIETLVRLVAKVEGRR